MSMKVTIQYRLVVGTSARRVSIACGASSGRGAADSASAAVLVLLCSCLHCRGVAHACALLCSRDFVVC